MPDAIAAPVVVGNVNCWFFTSANPACRALLPNQADTFALPAQYTYGNAGRNILYNNRLLQLDMSLYKKFRITESKSTRVPRHGIQLDQHAELQQPRVPTKISRPAGR